jgi:hypothetical protein
MGSKVSCSMYFQNYLLSVIKSPLLLVLNELDWLWEYPEIAGEFLSLVRSWYEQAKMVEIWQKLRLVLVYAQEIVPSVKLSQSPLNIGLLIKLPHLTPQQVEELAQRHGLDWGNSDNVHSLMRMLGGHPYLIRLALYHLVGRVGLQGNLEQLLQQAPTTQGIYHEYLRQYVLLLQREPELANAFSEVITAIHPVKVEPVIADKLHSLGLVNLAGDLCTPACELYRLYFQGQLNTVSNFTIPNQLDRLKCSNGYNK